jgi:hypothetical protein
MATQTQPEKVPIPRLVLGLGFLLLFVAVGIGAAMSGAGDVPKYIAGAAVIAIIAGAIGSVVQGRLQRGK